MGELRWYAMTNKIKQKLQKPQKNKRDTGRNNTNSTKKVKKKIQKQNLKKANYIIIFKKGKWTQSNEVLYSVLLDVEIVAGKSSNSLFSYVNLSFGFS